MVEFIDAGGNKIIGTRVSGLIEPQDFDQVKDVVSEKTNKYKKVCWYYEMTDFEQWELSSFWRDIIFSLMNTEHFQKIAFVGENTPQHIISEVSSVFTPAKVRHFDFKEKKAALKWIKEKP